MDLYIQNSFGRDDDDPMSPVAVRLSPELLAEVIVPTAIKALATLKSIDSVDSMTFEDFIKGAVFLKRVNPDEILDPISNLAVADCKMAIIDIADSFPSGSLKIFANDKIEMNWTCPEVTYEYLTFACSIEQLTHLVCKNKMSVDPCLADASI